jgi:hypothetical protein
MPLFNKQQSLPGIVREEVRKLTRGLTANTVQPLTMRAAASGVPNTGGGVSTTPLSIADPANGLALDEATQVLGIGLASAESAGALSATDWATFNNKEAALTFSTGLTRAANTITNDLLTGKAGGQTVVGGTAAGETLTLSSTSHATKGALRFGTSVYDEVNHRLGLGTPAPERAVHVVQESNSTPVMLDCYGTAPFSGLIMRGARGSFSTPSAVQTGTALGQINFRGYGATAFSGNSVSVTAYAAENWTDAAQGSYVTIGTTPTGSTTRAERLRIDAAGNLGIGVTAPLARLHLAADTTAAGGIQFGADVTLYRSAANVLKTDDTLHAASLAVTGAHVTYLALTDDLNTAIANAAAGDVLVLAAGTYTGTATITINKPLTLVGQGPGATTVQRTSTGSVVQITSDHVTLANLSVVQAVDSSTASNGIEVSAVGGDAFHDVTLENLRVQVSGATDGTRRGLYFRDAGGEVRHVRIDATSGTGSAVGLYLLTAATLETPVTLRVYQTDVRGIAGTTATGYFHQDSAATVNSTLALCYCKADVTGAGTSSALYGTGDNAITTADFCTLLGSTYDVNQGASASITLRSCLLLSNSINGTVADAGSFRANALQFGADVNLYRSAANVVKTDDKVLAALGVEVPSGQAFYLGDAATDGSWRMVRDGTGLVMQRRESETWVTKSTISA